MDDLLSHLNKPQQQAIKLTEGPMLILAGAGSGKTRVLTYKIVNLLKEGLAHGENILAVTFTNKAANEMKQRIQVLLQSYKVYTNLPWIGTFHSMCVKILRHNAELAGISPHFSIYDTSDQLDTIKDAMRRLGISEKTVKARSALAAISSAKNELIGPESYLSYAQGYYQENVASIYTLYQKLLRESSALDFDDLLMQTVLLFTNVPAVLEKYQKLFSYILIDEYQDTNRAQYMFSKLLADRTHNICVVGDDAQSIYSFRGATIKNILNFEHDYPEAKVIKLEQNYRSTKKILEASNQVILLNPSQKKKVLWTENEEGENITLYEAHDEQDEAVWIGMQIKDLLDHDPNLEGIAVLYRTNAQSRAIEEAMLKLGISYRMVGNVEFYSRREVKDILAYLRLIYNPLDDLSLKRIINIPRRGIGAKTILALSEQAAGNGQSLLNYLLKLPNEEILSFGKGVLQFVQLLRNLQSLSADFVIADFIDNILELTGYKEWLDDGSEESQARLENIKELSTVARKYSDLDPQASLEQFLEEVALIEDNADRNNKDAKVVLMTIHSAKGLEFDYVFVAGMEEGLFPHSRSYLEIEQMEEERRLAYVAMTRARKKLFMTHTQSRTYFGQRNSNPMSRFVADIPEHLVTRVSPGGWVEVPREGNVFSFSQPALDLAPGERVQHDVFGVGEVVDIDDSTIVIRFSKGTKELSREFAKLKKIS